MIVVNNIYEHDIDLFIAQLFHMDRDFKNLFIAEDANVISVEKRFPGNAERRQWYYSWSQM